MDAAIAAALPPARSARVPHWGTKAMDAKDIPHGAEYSAPLDQWTPYRRSPRRAQRAAIK